MRINFRRNPPALLDQEFVGLLLANYLGLGIILRIITASYHNFQTQFRNLFRRAYGEKILVSLREYLLQKAKEKLIDHQVKYWHQHLVRVNFSTSIMYPKADYSIPIWVIECVRVSKLSPLRIIASMIPFMIPRTMHLIFSCLYQHQ